MAPIAIALFVLGTIFGSFLTVVAYRLPRGQSFVAGRSQCPNCGATVQGRDNVPIVSWLVLKGRCRSCREPISWRYPIAEAALGGLWAASYLILGNDDGAELALGLILCAVLVTITLTDLELKLIPNAIVLGGAIAAVAIVTATDTGDLGPRVIAAAAGGGGMLLVALAYPRGMGMGDVKLVAMMGLYLGRAIAPALLIGFFAGAVVGSLLIARHGPSARKQAIPFGPFLAFGGIVALWFGDEIVDWYLDTFTG